MMWIWCECDRSNTNLNIIMVELFYILARHTQVQAFDLAQSTSKCASRQNTVHFFNLSTSKRAPRITCFHTFDFKLRATTACNFSSLIRLAAYLRNRRFSEPTFGPSGATKHWKNSVSPSLLFSLLTFSTSEFLPGSASSTLSEISL